MVHYQCFIMLTSRFLTQIKSKTRALPYIAELYRLQYYIFSSKTFNKCTVTPQQDNLSDFFQLNRENVRVRVTSPSSEVGSTFHIFFFLHNQNDHFILENWIFSGFPLRQEHTTFIASNAGTFIHSSNKQEVYSATYCSALSQHANS